MEILTSVNRLYISFKSLVNDFVYSFGHAALLLPAFGRQHRGVCITPQAVTHSLVLLKMGKTISRNMLSLLELRLMEILTSVNRLYISLSPLLMTLCTVLVVLLSCCW